MRRLQSYPPQHDAPTISSQQLLFSAPPHLCLTLSRFGHSAATGCELNDTPVIIPDILQIPISTLEEGEPAAAGYEVVSMILFNGRHYVTVAKSPTSGRWHLHDDSTVSACARAFVPDGFVPYVLFFTRDTVPLPVLLRGFSVMSPTTAWWKQHHHRSMLPTDFKPRVSPQTYFGTASYDNSC